MSKARDIHGLAEHAREEGDFLGALTHIDEATLLYSDEHDRLGLSEIQGSRFLTLRHLFEKTGDTNFLVLAKHAAMSAVEIAEKSGIKEALALPLFNLAKAHESLNEIPEAVELYKRSVLEMEANPPALHNRPAILNDMKVHQFVCEYKNGRKDALSYAESTVSLIENDKDEVRYTKDVWSSGGHMKIAEVLKNDNLDLAKDHLQKAKEIIDANPDLVLRKAQWEKLSKTF